MRPVQAPERGDDWLALTADELPVAAVYDWAVRPDCGAVVLFSGTVRDHAEGRDGRRAPRVRGLRRSGRQPRLAAIADRGPRAAGRASGASRCSTAPAGSTLGESSVLVVVSAPHRAEAFEAGPLRHRRAEGVGPDLEARDLARGQRVGHGRHADPRRRDRVVTGADRRHRRRRRRRAGRRRESWPCAAGAGPTAWRRSSARSTPCRRRPGGPSSTRSSSSRMRPNGRAA